MFEEKRRNIIISFVIMTLFFVLIGGLGALLGWFYKSAWLGAIIAGLISFIYFLIIQQNGSSAILRMGGAIPADPRKHKELIDIVEELSIAAGFKRSPKVYIIPHPTLNAFATGTSPENSAVAITEGLLKKLNREELEGVIAHEISHIQNRDSLVMLYAIMLSGVVVILSRLFLRSLIWGGRRDDKENNESILLIVIGLILAILAPFFALLIRLAISRHREYVADANAAILTRYPDGLANALEKISKEEHSIRNIDPTLAPLFIENPLKSKSSFFSTLFSTHPPIEERIRRLREM